MNIFGVIITKSRNLFAETFADHALNGPFIILSEVDSTNNYAMAKLQAGLAEAGTCFQAVEQTSGRGQRGRQWLAQKGQNITMSVCLRPVHPELPFLMPAVMALGCYDFIKESSLENVLIKWPNDVYIGDRKAAGILIDTLYHGHLWEWAVVGIGVNINQAAFGDLAHKATSLRIATNRLFDVTATARALHQCLLARLKWMKEKSAGEIMEAYSQQLYKKGEQVKLKAGTAVFSTEIRGVTKFGELVTVDTMERVFHVGEVEFV